MVQKKLPLINSAHGSETRNIINELIKLFNGMGYTYDEALQKAHDILDEAQKTNNMNKDVQSQVNKFISEFESEGTTNLEVVQARGPHEVLNNRLDESEKTIRDNKELVRKNLTVASTRSKPVVTFIDDDTRNNVYYRLKPIFESRNVPLAVACITGRFDNPLHMTEAQLRECYELGWEILGHSYTHPTGTQGLVEYSGDYNKLEYEIGEGSKGILNSMGYEVNGFVYPQGGHNFDIREITKRHHTYAFGGQGFNDKKLLDSMEIRRIAFGLSSESNPTVNGNSEKNTLAYYKECVDYAVETNSWLVFMSHVSAQTVAEDVIMGQLIDYIKSIGVDILNPKEAYEIHGNRYFAGDVLTNNYTILNKENELITSGMATTELEHNSRGFNSKITEFPERTISYMRTTNAFARTEKFPTELAGYLITYNLYDSDVTYNRQEYIPYTNSDTYVRSIDIATGEWKPFQVIISDKNFGLHLDESIDSSEKIHKMVRVRVPEVVVPPNSSVDKLINFTGLIPGKSYVTGNPAWGMIPNLMYNITVTDQDKLNIRIYNHGDTQQIVTSREWMISYML